MNIIKLDICVQVRNRWLRLLETMGCRATTMTGASNSLATASGASANSGNNYQHGGSSRGRGRGGQNRGGQRGAGGGRGGNRVVVKPQIPPASVRYEFRWWENFLSDSERI